MNWPLMLFVRFGPQCWTKPSCSARWYVTEFARAQRNFSDVEIIWCLPAEDFSKSSLCRSPAYGNFENALAFGRRLRTLMASLGLPTAPSALPLHAIDADPHYGNTWASSANYDLDTSTRAYFSCSLSIRHLISVSPFSDPLQTPSISLSFILECIIMLCFSLAL